MTHPPEASARRIDKNFAIACFILSLGIFWLIVRLFSPGVDTSPTHYFKVGSRQILLETAVSDQEKAQGLKGRTSLPDDRGMLFIVSPEQRVQLWMHGVQFPIDMVFLRDGRVVAVLGNVPPCTTPPAECPIYDSKKVVDSVIELPAGTAQALSLVEGSTIEILQVD